MKHISFDCFLTVFLCTVCVSAAATFAGGYAACGPDAGECCIANGTPGCNDLECCDAVCDADPFCCGQFWDQTCSDFWANELCFICDEKFYCPGQCDGDINDDGQVDGADLGILLGAFGPCPTDTACCADINGDGQQVDGADLGVLLGAFGPCPAESPCGTIGAGECCEPNGGLGCEDQNCCALVCAKDSFCCEMEWDAQCAKAAAEVCEIFCDGCPPDATQPCDECDEDANADCNGGCNYHDIDCCYANGTPGCEDADCEQAVCEADSFCCDSFWDATCADQAADLCSDLCDEFVPATDPIACGDVICGEHWATFSLADGPLRDLDWFEFTVDVESQVIFTVYAESNESFAVITTAQCPETQLAAGEFASTSQATACLAPGTYFAVTGVNFSILECDSASNDNDYVATLQCETTCPPLGCCLFDGTCQDISQTECNMLGGITQGLQTCEQVECDEIDVCGQANAGDCCVEGGNFTKGCNQADCCLTVCAIDPACCQDFWDENCADTAQAACDSCQTPRACCILDGSCELLSGVDCAAANGAFQGPDVDCETAMCPVNCGKANDQDCCDASGLPGCSDTECCTMICEMDPFCCDAAWDSSCAITANELCSICDSGACCFPDGSCEDLAPVDCFSTPSGIFQGGGTVCESTECVLVCDEDAGDCCSNNQSPACNDPECCGLVCSMDESCCSFFWDSFCAELASESCEICQQPGACCFIDGSCLVLFEQACNEMAGDYQGDSTGCEPGVCPLICPGKGDCCEVNETPGCNVEQCCDVVCNTDPFCCNNQWDEMCVKGAEKFCDICSGFSCPGEGFCCGPNGTPGCNDAFCCEIVCNGVPSCCEVGWDNTCAILALDLCPVCQ